MSAAPKETGTAQAEHLHLIITGGTIDSVFDATKDRIVPAQQSMLKGYVEKLVRPHCTLTQTVVCLEDSRNVHDGDRDAIIQAILETPATSIIITHGLYTLHETFNYLRSSPLLTEALTTKRAVLTGSLIPIEGFNATDAPFNLGFAAACAFFKAPGLYAAMNCHVFSAEETDIAFTDGQFKSAPKT